MQQAFISQTPVGPGGPFFITHVTLPNQFAHTRTHTRNVERVTATESRKHLAESILKFRPTLRWEHGGVQDNTGISTPQAQVFKLKSEIANYFGFKLKSLLLNIITRGLSRYLSHGLYGPLRKSMHTQSSCLSNLHCHTCSCMTQEIKPN